MSCSPRGAAAGRPAGSANEQYPRAVVSVDVRRFKTGLIAANMSNSPLGVLLRREQSPPSVVIPVANILGLLLAPAIRFLLLDWPTWTINKSTPAFLYKLIRPSST